MTVEAALTRKFGITFMDARTIATESRLKLNIPGYPSPEQKELLIAEATRLFEKKSERERKQMQRVRDELEQTKIETGSSSSLRSSSNGSSHEQCSSEFFSECSSVSSESRSSRKFTFLSQR